MLSAANTLVYGQSVTFTATAGITSPGLGLPTGVVTFKDGNTSIGTATLVGGATAMFTSSSLTVATHTISAVYGGDTNFSGSSAANFLETVNQAATTVTVLSAANTSVYGQSVTFTATAGITSPGAGTPTGLVTFKDGNTSIGTATLVGGATAMFTSSSLTVATHTISAVYGGDTNFSGSSAANFLETVNQAATTVTVLSAANTSVYGQSVTFTATAGITSPGAGTPTGLVTFKDGNTSIGTATLVGGATAMFTSSSLTVATHTISAVYGGDTNFSGSSGSVLQTVNTATTTTTVTSSSNPSLFGQSVTFTATVAASGFDSGGTVTFSDGSTALGTAGLSSGQATLSSVFNTVATHTITASYGGDTNFSGSTSGNFLQTVNVAASTTTVVSSVTSQVFGQAVTFTVTVTGANMPTGSVTFLDGGTSLGALALTSGKATLSSSALAGGSHSVSAVYAGDGNFQGSTSTTVTVSISSIASTATLASSLNPASYGQSVVFTITINSSMSGTPTGFVTLTDGAVTLGTAALGGAGQATFSVATLNVANHTLKATYSGDQNFNASTTAPLTQTITRGSTTVALVSSANPSPSHGTVQITATVVGTGEGAATGSVTFLDGGNSLGARVLTSGGHATFITSALTIGNHPITASYEGDANYTGSSSDTLIQVVSPVATLSIPTNLAATAGGTVTVPVNLNKSDYLDEVNLAIAYDTSRLQVLSSNDVLPGTLTSEPGTDGNGKPWAFDTIVVSIDDTAGTVLITAYRTNGPIYGFGSGSVVTITFHVRTDAPIGPAIVNLERQIGATPTILHASDLSGNDLNNFILQPTPSNVAGDSLDGIVTVKTLQLTSFTPTGIGFAAVFNEALNVGTPNSPILNLYDNQSGTLGPADVTLVRASNGASISGSLVIDSTGTRITFAETGESGVLPSSAPSTLFGVLPNDTYTVTLRSSTNGFQDINGNLLDGNADGMPGGDYVTTFVVNNSSNSVTVTLPDFARGSDQLVNVPNTDPADTTFSNGLPLRLYNGISFTGSTTCGNQTVQVLTTSGLVAGDTVTGPGIFGGGDTITAVGPGNQITLLHNATATSANLANGGVVLNDSHGAQTITLVSLTLAYNPSLLNVTGYSIIGLGDPSDSSVTTFDTSTAGLVKITFATSTGIVLGAGGSQTFLSLQSNVPSTANYATKEILDLQNISINAGSITPIDDAAVHVSGFLGDSTGDETYTGLDAQLIARLAVGIDPGFQAWVLADPLIVGDVNGDSVLTGLDALQMARQAVGITQSTIPSLPSVPTAILGPDPMLSIPTDFAANPQATVWVPVNLDHSDGLDSVELSIAYDTSRLEVYSAADVHAGSLLKSFDSFAVSLDKSAGIIRLSATRSAGPLEGFGGGSVARNWIPYQGQCATRSSNHQPVAERRHHTDSPGRHGLPGARFLLRPGAAAEQCGG